MSVISRNGTRAYVGLPDREASKLQDLWQRDELGVELSVEVKAPVVVGVYPMRIARFVIDQTTSVHPAPGAFANGDGTTHGLRGLMRPGPIPGDGASPDGRPRPVYADARTEDVLDR